MKLAYTILCFSFASLLFSCEETPEKHVQEPSEPSKEKPVFTTFQEEAKYHVQSALDILANEKYSMKIYYANINNDSIEDAIITVNRLNFAIDQSIKAHNEVKAAEVGYLGNFNFIFFFDGAMNQFSVPIPIPSSPGRELGISFESIVSPNRKDIIVDYRIRNSSWKSYYSVLNDTDVLLVFRCKEFDNLGTSTPEANFVEYGPSKNGVGKDIFIYKGELTNNSLNVPDVYSFEPQITKKKELLYQFMYDSKYAKFRLYENGPGADEARRLAKIKGK